MLGVQCTPSLKARQRKLSGFVWVRIPTHTITLTSPQTSGITGETIFNFTAATNVDVTRVVMTFSGGGQLNMNQVNARTWTMNTRQNLMWIDWE